MATTFGSSPGPAPLVAAVLRVRSASVAFLGADAAGTLPLGTFHRDELRMASLHLLAQLDDHDAASALAIDDDRLRRVDRAISALTALDLAAVRGEDRERLLSAAAGVIATLREAGDDVTRELLDVTPPGPELASLVFTCDPATLSPDAQVSYCQAAQRLESATHAHLNSGLVAFAGANPRSTQFFVDGDEYELTDVRSSELASALSWSGTKARNAVESARMMSNELDALVEAATSGSVQPEAIGAITDGALLLASTIDTEIEKARQALRYDTDSGEDLTDRIWELTSAREELVQRYDNAVSAFASTHTLAETKRKVRDTLAKLDPDGFEARRAKAREVQSGVEFRGLPDAMAMITAVMPAEHATACYRAIDAVARDPRQSDTEAPVGVRRSDALLAICTHAAKSAATPVSGVDGEATTSNASKQDAPGTAHGLSAHVDLVMTLDAFLGLTETAAECVGAGPIPASAARAVIADAALVTVRRVIVETSTGHALDVGVRRYRLTEAEREYIAARDRRCRRPGCNQPAHKCETDHATPFDAGGASRTDNLGALCLRHHQEKTHGGWNIEASAADGSCTFVSPLGRRYERASEPVLPWAVPDADSVGP